jgi:hypothetical protein
MAPGRRFHLREQVIEERRLFVLITRWPSAVVDPGVRQCLIRRRQRHRTISAYAPYRVTVTPALEVDNLTGPGPIGHELSDQLAAIQRTS